MFTRILLFLLTLPLGLAFGFLVVAVIMVFSGVALQMVIEPRSEGYFGVFLATAYLAAALIAVSFIYRLERDPTFFRFQHRLGMSDYYARVANRSFATAWSMISIFCASLGGIIAYQLIVGRAPTDSIDFTLAYMRLSSELMLFLFDNFLKVMFFDFFDIFEPELSQIQPQTHVEKIATFALRLAMSLTIAKYVIDVVTLKRPAPASG